MTQNHLPINLYDSPAVAPNYRKDQPNVKVATVKAGIVLKGMVSGKCSVDLHFTTEDGIEAVAMLSGELIKGLAAAISGAEQR